MTEFCSLPKPLELQLKECRTLPSVPAVVLQVLDICQDENVSIGQVSKVLMRDPALSGKILQVANSPFYGVRSQVKTLERAVTILGINATLSLALSFSLVRNLRNGKGSGFDHHAFWLRCIISAAASRIIGIWANMASREELFLSGLLQDIGMLVLSEAIPEKYGNMISRSQGDHAVLAEMEKAEFGCNHAAISAWLLKRWNLPLNLQLAAAASHGATVGEEKLPIASKCVLLASYIAGIWTQPDTFEATTVARDKAYKIMQMSPEQFENVLKDIARVLPEVTKNLEIDIGNEEFIERVMDQARCALVELSLHANRMIQEIEIQAKRDELTSLANRAYLNEILPQQFNAARERSRPFSVLFIDIDRFKSINDTYGHQGGDSVLVSVARILRSCTREFDIVARYGGDEFVILLASTNEKAALNLSRRIQEVVMGHPHMMDDITKIAVTISVGCATFSEDHTFRSANEIIEAADRCLYVAKTTGRNRVVSFDQLNSCKISSISDCAKAG